MGYFYCIFTVCLITVCFTLNIGFSMKHQECQWYTAHKLVFASKNVLPNLRQSCCRKNLSMRKNIKRDKNANYHSEL